MPNRRNFLLSSLGAAVLVISPVSAYADKVIGKGTFAGASGHKTSGTVSIVMASAGVEVRLGSNFSLDSAPDPWLGFGKNGKYDPASEIAILKSNSGAQVYRVAGPIDVSKYNEFYIWCRKFAVPLGIAKLN